MDIKKLIQALNPEEKKIMFELLSEELMIAHKVEELTTIAVFCKMKEKEMSSRLRNILKANSNWLGQYIETISSTDVRRCRNSGKVTEREFVGLRGY